MTMKLVDEDNEDTMPPSEPDIITKDFRISVNMLDAHEVKIVLNEDAKVFTAEESADESEEPSLKRDQRRLHLLNNPNYAIILDFVQKFRDLLNFNLSSLRKLEENLLSEQSEMTPQFNEFLLMLFRRVSSGKPIPKERFMPTIIRFAGRYSDHDAEQIENHGYALASIDTKVRVLKNVLEKQFDRNKSFRNSLDQQRAFELRSKPFGRDRFGASYWLFVDDKCFIRLFRENVDKHRTWMNVAKNRDELESLIRLLITDHVVRTKFPDWKFKYPSFNDSTPSNEFEERYAPNWAELYESSETSRKTVPSSTSESSVLLYPNTVTTDNVDLHPVVNIDRKENVSPPMVHQTSAKLKEKEKDVVSDQESGNSSVINANRRESSSSTETAEDFYSVASEEVKANVVESEESQDTSEANVKVEPTPSVSRPSGLGLKLVDYDDSGSDQTDEAPFQLEIPEDLLPKFDNPEEYSQSNKTESHGDETEENSVPSQNEENTDLPIALRRPKRTRRTANSDQFSSSSSSSVSLPRTIRSKRSGNGTWRNSHRPTTSRSRRRRRRAGRFSSTSTETEKVSDDDDDLDDGSLGNEDDLLEEEEEEQEENDDDGVPSTTAKTVANLFGKMNLNGNERKDLPSIACRRCGKSDRPESLLLCEDCDEAYHLECTQPELFAIPEYNWFCSFCDHKRLCEGLIDKLIQLIKDDQYSQIKRRIAKVKRIPPPFQEYPRPGARIVPVREPSPVPKPMTKRRVNTILSSDEEEEPQQKQPIKKSKTISVDERSEPELVQDVKTEPVEKPIEEHDENSSEEAGKRRLRTCRKQTTDYRFDEFDSKIKEAIIETTTTEKSQVDTDSDATEIMSESEKQKIETLHQEFDNDFDGDDGRNDDDDFVPYARRSGDEDSRSAIKENTNEAGPSASTEENPKKKRRRQRRQSSTASAPAKKKSTPKATGGKRRKSTVRSEEDSILVEANPENIPDENDANETADVVFKKSEGAFVKVKPRQPRRPPAPKKKKNALQQDHISDEEEANRPPPNKRAYHRRRSGSNDSFVGDDDDYEKLAHKRRLFHHGKVIERQSILSHIKKLVGDEDEDEDEEGEGEGEGLAEREDGNDSEGKKDTGRSKTTENKKKFFNDYEEQVVSDDDDFPDEQEIMRTIGVTDLKQAAKVVPNASMFRCQFMTPLPTYQFTMVDPTAHVDFLAPAEPSTAEPSDPNGNPSQADPSTATNPV